MSRLIRIFTVCLVNLFIIPIIKIWNKQGCCPNLADHPNLPDITLSCNSSSLIFLKKKNQNVVNCYVHTRNAYLQLAQDLLSSSISEIDRQQIISRGSNMSAHVLLNLLNELGKRDKMQGLPSILSLFRNEFNKFNNTRAWMLDSIYHMTLRFIWNLISAVKTS